MTLRLVRKQPSLDSGSVSCKVVNMKVPVGINSHLKSSYNHSISLRLTNVIN